MGRLVVNGDGRTVVVRRRADDGTGSSGLDWVVCHGGSSREGEAATGVDFPTAPVTLAGAGGAVAHRAVAAAETVRGRCHGHLSDAKLEPVERQVETQHEHGRWRTGLAIRAAGPA